MRTRTQVLIGVVSLTLSVTAALVRDRIWFAALFFTVAASTTIAAWFIEPATTAATFGEDA